MQLFYEPQIEEKGYLSPDDSRHCVKVLRRKEGETVHVVDGKGSLYQMTIKKASSKRCELHIDSVTKGWKKASKYIHMAIAPTKSMDRINVFVEKAVELGVSEISFIRTFHSERKVIKTERVERVAVAAMKQSLKAYLPVINEIIPLEEFIKKDHKGRKLVAHLDHNAKALTSFTPLDEVVILIGPEGDFDTEELARLERAGFLCVFLGKSRLRTETAGMVALAILNLC